MLVKDQEPYLEAVDAALIPVGFKRASRAQEWSTASGSTRFWMHLNFGLAVINPSYGVEYLDLKRRFRSVPGAVFGTMGMVSSLFDPPRFYSEESSPDAIASDLVHEAWPAAQLLADRQRVVESLLSPQPATWMVVSYPDRIRLAPLLLVDLGNQDEAVAVAERFFGESVGKDQFLPGYGEFLRGLKGALAGCG